MIDIIFARPKKLDLAQLDRDIRAAGYDISGLSANSKEIIVHLNAGDDKDLEKIIKAHKPDKDDNDIDKDLEKRNKRQAAIENLRLVIKTDNYSDIDALLRDIIILLVGD